MAAMRGPRAHGENGSQHLARVGHPPARLERARERRRGPEPERERVLAVGDGEGGPAGAPCNGRGQPPEHIPTRGTMSPSLAADSLGAPVRDRRPAMSSTRRNLSIVYGVIAFVALVGTWSQNIAYFRADDGVALGFVLATVRFWSDTFATPASGSITVDLLLFFAAAAVFMVLESRRLGIRWVWAYVVLGVLIAISVTFPLFLIARERRLAAIGA
jgi:hypothetical protein